MLVIGVSGIFFIKPSNNLQNFYTVSKKNFKNDQKVNTILQYQNSTQFFFILGKTSQEVLEKEELLLLQLNKLISNNTLGSYRATSQLIPSFKKQKENLSLIENNLMLPYLSQQALFLGFSEQETKVIEDDFNKIKKTYIITPKEDKIVNPLKVNNPNDRIVVKNESVMASVVVSRCFSPST